LTEKTGKLLTVKALVERYVHKVIITGEQIEIQFNLKMHSRVVSYSADLYQDKEIPRSSPQETVVFVCYSPTKMLATFGAGDGKLKIPYPHHSKPFKNSP